MYDVLKSMEDLAPPKVYYTFNAVELGPRLFPASKHRSKRIHKKLVKRFGGEYEWTKPCIFKAGKSIFANPIFKQAIKANDRAELQGSQGRSLVLRTVPTVHSEADPDPERVPDLNGSGRSPLDRTRWWSGWNSGAKIRVLDEPNGMYYWRNAT